MADPAQHGAGARRSTRVRRTRVDLLAQEQLANLAMNAHDGGAESDISSQADDSDDEDEPPPLYERGAAPPLYERVDDPPPNAVDDPPSNAVDDPPPNAAAVPPPNAAAVPPPPVAGRAQDDEGEPFPSWRCHDGIPWIPLSQGEIEENLVMFFEILDFWDILYIFHLTIGQLATCAKILIRIPDVQRRRPPHIQQLIADFRATHGDQEFHDQELNELACIMDYLIKTKCNIMAIHRQLQAGDPRFMLTSFEHAFINDDFVDEESGRNIPVADIYVYIPRVTRNRICQGTANQWFGKFILLCVNFCPSN